MIKTLSILTLFLITFALPQPDGYDGMCWELNELTGEYSWVNCDGGDFDIDIYGCTDPLATNYNPMANVDDQSCYYGWSMDMCMESECGQMLYNGNMTCEQITYYGVDCTHCEECNTTIDIQGCTDPNALNYNPEATIDDGTCQYLCLEDEYVFSGQCIPCPEGLSNESGDNPNAGDTQCDEANQNECSDGEVLDCSGDGDCIPESWIGDGFEDCEDQQYGADLTCYGNDGGDCEPEEDIYGCTDETADNYNSDATIDDGSCLYNGCPLNQVPDCNASYVCVDASFIGDGWCQDGSDSNYNFDVSCYDNDGGDCDEHQDDLDLTLTLLRPQGGDHIQDYTNVEVQWEYEGSDSTDIYLSFNCSYYLGGGLIEVERNINLLDGSAIIDLSTDIYGENIDAETIYANFKIIASDTLGNSTAVECSDDFIIGNPRGEINANYIDEEINSILIDWAWMEDQTIMIRKEAIEPLAQQGYEFIKIFDLNGIFDIDCSNNNETGPTSLSVLDIRSFLNNPQDIAITLPCGFDYCYEEGSRIIGYLPQNQIRFSVGFYDQSEYELFPQSPQIIDGPMLFNNGTYIVDSFNIGLFLDNYNAFLVDDGREWDDFNVYGKITNHQGSTTRECNNDGICQDDEAIATCFDDCCNQPGTGENEDWCFLENVTGISNFEDNMTNGNYVPYLPAGTSSATFNYRIWLLDNNGDEVVKTIDTEIDYEADNLFCEGDGDINGDNEVNVVDIVSLVSEILNPGTITDPILLCEADINGDGPINVVDVVTLVSIILNN